MKTRNLLLILAVVLLGSAQEAQAQQTPPAPSSPPTPYIVAQDEPSAFSFFINGGNYLGIQPEDINQENMSRYGLSAPRGVGVSRVSEGSPAERAGLKKGDVITQLDGEPVTSTRKLLRLIGEAAPEQAVRLTVSRSGSEQQITAKLAKRESSSAARAYGALIPSQPDAARTPRTPQAWGNTPEVFSFGFGNNRRVGITTTPLTKQLADFLGISDGRGLLVTSVGENSPASKAGLKAGDIITEVGGEKVEDSEDFVRAINRKDEGEVTLSIIRDKSRRTINVTPERRQTPAFNLSDFPTGPMARLMTNTPLRIALPNLRVLQSMPKIENIVVPKLNRIVLPRVMMPRRIESLPVIPLLPSELD
jgi:serine protease Do